MIVKFNIIKNLRAADLICVPSRFYGKTGGIRLESKRASGTAFAADKDSDHSSLHKITLLASVPEQLFSTLPG